MIQPALAKAVQVYKLPSHRIPRSTQTCLSLHPIQRPCPSNTGSSLLHRALLVGVSWQARYGRPHPRISTLPWTCLLNPTEWTAHTHVPNGTLVPGDSCVLPFWLRPVVLFRILIIYYPKRNYIGVSREGFRGADCCISFGEAVEMIAGIEAIYTGPKLLGRSDIFIWDLQVGFTG